MKISFASKKDKKQLLKYFGFYRDADYSAARVDYFLKYGKTIIAKENREIIGLMQWHVKENPNHGLAEIEEVFVYGAYRGKGVATKLLKFVTKSIRAHFREKKIRARKVFLFVLKKNKVARRLYEKAGFRKVASVGELFEDKKKDLLYALDL